MAGQIRGSEGSNGGSAAGRIAREVSSQQASLLAKLRAELGSDSERFAAAAERLALDFGAVTATAVEAAATAGAASAEAPAAAPEPPAEEPAVADLAAVEELPRAEEPAVAAEAPHELPSLYRPGHMRHRLEQLVETNRRYGHPFGIAVFGATGPATRDGAPDHVMTILGAALRDSIRIVDEAFRLEEDAICVLAPNQRTVEGVQMAERLLGNLDELERAGGLRVAVAAGVAACPEHGEEVDELLHKADAALWRARAVGQPVGVGALNGA